MEAVCVEVYLTKCEHKHHASRKWYSRISGGRVGLSCGSSRDKAALLGRGAAVVRRALRLGGASYSELSGHGGAVSLRKIGVQLDGSTCLRVDVVEAVHSGEGVLANTGSGEVVRSRD